MFKKGTDLRTSFDDVNFDTVEELQAPPELDEAQRVVKNLITLELIHNSFHKLRFHFERLNFSRYNGLSKMETLRLAINELIHLQPYLSKYLKDSQRYIASLLVSNYKHLQ